MFVFRMSNVCGRTSAVCSPNIECRGRMSKVRGRTSTVARDHRKSFTKSNDLRTFGTNVAVSGRHSTNVLTTVDNNDCRQKTYGKLA